MMAFAIISVAAVSIASVIVSATAIDLEVGPATNYVKSSAL